ncbi:hypothetical protein [Roseomonas sp. KE0001]|uniref:hypothetical protein n=1 Tax=unclassified Roseomonas TaxID=2617492 RepID=UPI0018E02EBC|nr:hypothetical protein [Roseomonas sp. KE0001]MBI0433875.1 hypothetical protein [Roseomonas sp. KE0001]
MPKAERLIHGSSNGDSWYLVQDPDRGALVRHEPNAPSGGAVSEIPVATFLARGNGPEQAELLRLIGTLAAQMPEKEAERVAQVLR